MFTFPFGPRPFRFLLAFVLAFFALMFSGLAIELVKPVVQAIPLFHHMDDLLFEELWGIVGYVGTFAAAGATLYAFTERAQRTTFTNAIGLRFSDLRERGLKLFGAGFLGFIGINVFTQLLYHFVTLPTPQSPAGDEAQALSGTPLAIFCFMAVILAPIVEETVFRGLLQNMLRGVFRGKGTNLLWLRDLVAVVIASAIFAAAHGTPTGFPVLFISGLMMGVVYWRTGSLWASMTVHFLNNFTVMMLMVLGGH